jgi:glycosyltransferase involved in cell wall biosynthesis
MDNKNIFIWSPFTSKIGTIKNVINSSGGIIKFTKSKIPKISLINVFGEWNEYIDEINLKKIRLENLNILDFIKSWKKEGLFRSRLCYLLIFLFSFFPLVSLIKRKKPNFLIIHLMTSLPLIIFFLFNFKTKLILHIAGHPKMNILRKTIWKVTSKKIFKVICPSNELKLYLLENGIFDENKLEVIEDPHIIIHKIQKLKKVEVSDPFFDSGKILISIGRLTKQKNYSFLIKNFKILQSKYNNIKLLIIGSGEQKIYLENLIKKLELQNKIRLLGYENNVYKYLRKSNYYISTSIWEGSSLAMIDAAIVGLPILCSDCPSGRKEFIGNDERGFLYRESDGKDFLDKFSLMNEMNSKAIKKMIFNAKIETRKFTLFRNSLKLSKIVFKL